MNELKCFIENYGVYWLQFKEQISEFFSIYFKIYEMEFQNFLWDYFDKE